MSWFLPRPAVSLVISVFLVTGVIESFAQEAERVNSAKASPSRPPGAKRSIPKLVIDPEDRAILLKSLADGVRDAESQTDPQQRVNSLANMACGQFLAGDLAAARATFAKAVEATDRVPGGGLTKALSLLVIATQLGEYGDVADARAAVDSAIGLMRKLDPANSINIARGIARAEAMIGQDVGAKAALEEALDAVTKLTNEAAWQRSLDITVEGFIEAGDFDRVLDIAEAIPDLRIELRGSQLARVAAKLPKVAPETAKPVLARALEIASAIASPPVKAETLANLAVAQAGIGDVAGAIATTDRIGKAINDPDVNSFKPLPLLAIASALAVAGQKDKARARFDEAIQLARAIGPDNADLKARRLRNIAAEQAKAGMFADALKTADLITNDDYHKSHAFSEIGNAQVVAKDLAAAVVSFQRALELAKAIKERPKGPRDNVDIRQQQALYEVACGFASVRSFDEAVKVAELAASLDPNRRTHHSLYALSQIAGELAWTGDIERALKAAGSIEDEWNRYNAFERVAKLEGEAGGEADACSWIAKFEDPQIRLRLLWSVVKGLAKRSSNLREGLPDLRKLKKKETAK